MNKENISTIFLQRLKTLNTGDLAILKKASGASDFLRRGAIGVLYSLLPEECGDEQTHFLVATLYSLNPTWVEGENFGASMRRLKIATQEDSLDRRMEILLASDYDRSSTEYLGGELGYRLRQCIRRLANHGIGLDWGLLLYHLGNWNHSDQWVQKQWAKAYYLGNKH